MSRGQIEPPREFPVREVAQLVCAAEAPAPDPIAAAIDAVPSYRIYQLEQHASPIAGQ